jgi:hypothetical protein
MNHEARSQRPDAARRGKHSHMERGNEKCVLILIITNNPAPQDKYP